MIDDGANRRRTRNARFRAKRADHHLLSLLIFYREYCDSSKSSLAKPKILPFWFLKLFTNLGKITFSTSVTCGRTLQIVFSLTS